MNLEKGTQPPVGPIYSLSASEQEALKEFIEETLTQVLFNQSLFHMVHWFYLSRRKMVYCAFVLTSAVAKLGFIQR